MSISFFSVYAWIRWAYRSTREESREEDATNG